MKKTLLIVASMLFTLGYANAVTPEVAPEKSDSVVSTVYKVKDGS